MVVVKRKEFNMYVAALIENAKRKVGVPIKSGEYTFRVMNEPSRDAVENFIIKHMDIIPEDQNNLAKLK